jgi:hypothetical protein
MGPIGATGAQGATGNTGPVGPTGGDFGSSSGFAQNAFGGTGATGAAVACNDLIPLPDNQNLGVDVTADGANELFTFTQAGRYAITVNLNVQEPNQLGFTVEAGGSAVPPLTFGEASGPTFVYSSSAIVNLSAGADVGVRLICPGWWTDPVILQPGLGASLTVVRIQ